ncbi:hypothetical protein KR222_004711 [Zaprionus bogoriensis]|nr:hypothetical protein KR222_004711 [Zaprionus bogoriensis]
MEYNMLHKHRGQALIFNHEHFLDPSLRSREGTRIDGQKLQDALLELGFKVNLYMDLCKVEILEKINMAAAQDHSQCDCICIAILSHGLRDFVYAKETFYPLKSLFSPLTSSRCPTLAGKPKLFFIQACRGNRTDPGFSMHTPETCESSESFSLSYDMPLEKDFLIASSTMPGFVSWRNTAEGSWFIESLCLELSQQGKSRDLLTLLAFVAQHVSNKESYAPWQPSMHEKKQIACTKSTLTRILYFRDKPHIIESG